MSGVGEDDCFEIPTGFTPNGDGFNDTWVIGGAEYLINANVQIFNRWGQRVFILKEIKNIGMGIITINLFQSLITII